MRRLGVALLVATSSCRCDHARPRDAAPRLVTHDAAPAQVDAEPPDAAPILDAAPQPTAVRRLFDALAPIDPHALADLLDRGEPPPADARAAIDALVAWDRARVPLQVACTRNPKGLDTLVSVGNAALVTAADRDDPVIATVARAGRALRAPDNDPYAIAAGAELGVAVARWLTAHGGRTPRALDGLGLEPDLVLRAAKAQARCTAINLEGMHDIGADELAQLETFLADTVTGIEAAHDPSEIARFLDERHHIRMKALRDRLVDAGAADQRLVAALGDPNVPIAIASMLDDTP